MISPPVFVLAVVAAFGLGWYLSRRNAERVNDGLREQLRHAEEGAGVTVQPGVATEESKQVDASRRDIITVELSSKEYSLIAGCVGELQRWAGQADLTARCPITRELELKADLERVQKVLWNACYGSLKDRDFVLMYVMDLQPYEFDRISRVFLRLELESRAEAQLDTWNIAQEKTAKYRMQNDWDGLHEDLESSKMISRSAAGLALFGL